MRFGPSVGSLSRAVGSRYRYTTATIRSRRIAVSHTYLPARTLVIDPSRGCTPMSRTPAAAGPVETSIHDKLVEALEPIYMRILNDSSKHAHHAPMRASGGGNGETHFTVELVSPNFENLSTIKRHRLVNGLLKEEFEDKGLHALSLKLKTPEEWDRTGF